MKQPIKNNKLNGYKDFENQMVVLKQHKKESVEYVCGSDR